MEKIMKEKEVMKIDRQMDECSCTYDEYFAFASSEGSTTHVLQFKDISFIYACEILNKVFDEKQVTRNRFQLNRVDIKTNPKKDKINNKKIPRKKLN